MTRRGLVVMCCVLLSAAWAPAQSRGGKSDPISGTWSGRLGPENSEDGRSVTLTLKFDGKSAVTGTIEGFSNPGNVKSGTFDPKTGVLKLRLGKVDDTAVLLVMEGTVAQGKAAGKVSGEITGKFTLTKQPTK